MFADFFSAFAPVSAPVDSWRRGVLPEKTAADTLCVVAADATLAGEYGTTGRRHGERGASSDSSFSSYLISMHRLFLRTKSSSDESDEAMLLVAAYLAGDFFALL